jgi:hypothetical protein
MKSLEFFKPTLATTLAIVLAWLLSVGPAQAGYTVTLQQVGPNVVATGSGAINLTGLTFSQSTSLNAEIRPNFRLGPLSFVRQACRINTGPTSSSVDSYVGSSVSGPTSFGGFGAMSTSSGSGNMVGITKISSFYYGEEIRLSVPKSYVSGTHLSGSATYSDNVVGVTPGTYVWTWGRGKNQKFTLKIEPGIEPATHITNVSTRAAVGTEQNVAIAGFIITGTTFGEQVMIRGLGPTLSNFNVGGVLADPLLRLYDGSGSLIFSNNDWKDTQPGDIRATGLAPSFDAESAILIGLSPGQYTAILSGNNGTTGVGLVEVYDINSGAFARLTNVSTRGFVGTGDNELIAGFIASGGNGSTQVVMRGLGPTLAQPQFGISGALADPVLSLMDSNGNVVQTNNNWRDTQPAEISATGKAPPNDLEAAILATVAPGNYTAILSGNGDGTGIGLVEVYKLP